MTAARRITAASTLFALTTLSLGACSDSNLSGLDGSLTENASGKTSGPSGLEQRLTAKVEGQSIGSPFNALLTITSTIVNTGSSAVALTARECLAQATDIESTAQVERFDPLVSCAAVSSTRTLAPGESSGVLQVQLGVRSGPGTYTVKLRHALSPEFRGEVSFRVQ